MLRIFCLLAIFAWTAAAHGQPAPRVVFDVTLPQPEGLKIDQSRAKFVLGADGPRYLLRHYYTKSEYGNNRGDQHIDLVPIGPQGTAKPLPALPLDKMRPDGFGIRSICGAVIASGDVVVFSSFNENDNAPKPPPVWRKGSASLLRLAADGGLKTAAPVRPPGGREAEGYEFFHDINCLATPDNAVILGGDYQSNGVWLARLGLDGTKRWETDAMITPLVVSSLGLRADGSLVSIIRDWDGYPYLQRHAPNGKALVDRRLKRTVDSTGILRQGVVLIGPIDKAARASEVVFMDDAGGVLRRAPWSFHENPWADTLVAVGDGFVARVPAPGDNSEMNTIVRVNAQGKILWRTAPIRADALAAAKTGEVIVLDTSERGGGKTWRLISYADPQTP